MELHLDVNSSLAPPCAPRLIESLLQLDKSRLERVASPRMLASAEEQPLGAPSLSELCLQAAAGPDDYWRVQRRQLAYLPEEAANELLRRLLLQRRISPPQLELFQHSVTSAALSGAGITAAWLSYLGAYSALHTLSLHRCTKLRDGHLAPLAALAPSLQELHLEGCSGLTDGAAQHLLPLAGLRALDLSGTGMGDPAISALCSTLAALTALSLAHLPVTDASCQAIGGGLCNLQRLVLSATEVGDEGMQHLHPLTALTALDLSATQVHCPPVLTSLRELRMVGCSLGLADDSLQEALWLHLGAALPQLTALHLASTTLLPGHGQQLLNQLLAGSGGSLRSLDLRESGLIGDLGCLAGASQLTWLDLGGTAVADCQLSDLALLPLAWASLAGTPVGDEGVAQVLAMTTLSHLDLSNTCVSDASWAVLAQLPLLSWLDLSGTSVTFTTPPEGQQHLAALTHLRLHPSQADNRSCKHLAAAAPALRELWLGGKGVEDKGLKALCSLPRLQRLHLSDCGVSDAGLLSSLPRCPTLRQLELRNCWLASAAGVQAAAAAAVRAGGQLAEVTLDRAAVPLFLGPASPAPPSSKRPGCGSSTPARGSPLVRPNAGAAGASGTPSGSSGGGGSVGQPRSAGRRAGVLPRAVLAHDERLVYTREEMLELAAGQGLGAAEEALRLSKSLPSDLRSTPA